MKLNDQKHLIRIVRLTLEPGKMDDFFKLFNKVKGVIREFSGCHHLALLQDADFPNIVTTYSIWENEPALEQYRKSAFFKDTWSATKPLFAAPPVAQSYFQLLQVDAP